MHKAGAALPEWVKALPDRQRATVRTLYEGGWNVRALETVKGGDRVRMTYQGWGTVKEVRVKVDGTYWL